MLTPAKIRNHHFDASGRNAYKAESVDSFFEQVAESYEQMFRENGEMYKKIGILAEMVDEYKKDEDNIRNALLTAQRMADKITREAKEKADALLNDAEQRAKTENDRVDALTNDALQKATLQAQSIIDDAQKQAEKMIYDATYESKSAAVSARDTMIKEEATLETMKAEVAKFKKQILDAYNEQLALIETLPEVVYAKFGEQVEEEKAVEEAPIDEVAEEAPVEAPVVEEADKVEVAEETAMDDALVEQLQQLINETEDTDAEDEVGDEDEEEAVEFTGEIVLPEIDDSEEEIEKLSEEISSESTYPDIMFTKPSQNTQGTGFAVNMDKITEIESDDFDDEDDETDDFDEDDGDDSFSSKFKGFFKK